MDHLEAQVLRDYPIASRIEWVEADGAGGASASSVTGANTRKQHAVLSVALDSGERMVMVANLQETLFHEGRAFDVSTNAYSGALHPLGYRALEHFTNQPWPTWRYRFDIGVLEKELFAVHGEHTVVVTYTLREVDHPVMLVVRPMLAFRDHNALRSEKGCLPGNWQVTTEFVECQAFENGPTLYIAHPNARVDTMGMWYRSFLYERDKESHLDCIEDLYHPGALEMALSPGVPVSLVFSSPSPRSVEQAASYASAERKRRRAVREVGRVPTDPFFERLLQSAEAFVYDRLDGAPGISPGLPWGECETYRGLLAFTGLMLVPRRYDVARAYLDSVGKRWSQSPSITRLAFECDTGQMHRADVPLWLVVACWRYWRVTRDADFPGDRLVSLVRSVVNAYRSGGDVRCTEHNLIEVGHEEGAQYEPLLPLGTNVLWYNAQNMLADLLKATGDETASRERDYAQRTLNALSGLFSCETRPGLADSVMLKPLRRSEALRISQVLAAGLPYCAVENLSLVSGMLKRELGTPFGPRTVSPGDATYVGNGTDVNVLPKVWSGSVDTAWFGYYCDAMKRVGEFTVTRDLFAPFVKELDRRGLDHISGAFAGDAPHEPCDYVASSSALGEILRIYGREIVGFSSAL